jgi:hypothetical protein
LLRLLKSRFVLSYRFLVRLLVVIQDYFLHSLFVPTRWKSLSR